MPPKESLSAARGSAGLSPHRTTEFRNSGQIILMFRRQECVSQLRLQRDECTRAMVGDELRHTTNSQFQIVPLTIREDKTKTKTLPAAIR